MQLAWPVRLLQLSYPHGLDRTKGVGISLRLTTSQNIDDLANQIRERGGVLETEPRDMAGVRMFRLLDPDGFKLVVSSEA